MKNKFNFKIGFLVFSIIAFLVVLVSASFAYYATSTSNPTGSSSIANANVTVPVGCTFSANPVSVLGLKCDISGQTGATINFNDNIITTAEMTESYKGNKVAAASCALTVEVNGNKGCSCNYALEIERVSGSDVYTPTNVQELEFTAQIDVQAPYMQSTPETNINTLIGTPIYTESLTVGTTGVSRTELFVMHIRFYNTPSNQSQTIAGKHFSYALKAYATKCNGATPPQTITPSLASLCTGSGTTAGSKYSCTFADGDARNYYVLGTNSEDSTKIDLLAEQNMLSDYKWCDYLTADGTIPNSCNHQNIDPFINHLRLLYGNDVEVKLPSYSQLLPLASPNLPSWAHDYMAYNSHEGTDYCYWTDTPSNYNNYSVWIVDLSGSLKDDYSTTQYCGIRPVITLKKS